jgi:hypothetical protein
MTATATATASAARGGGGGDGESLGQRSGEVHEAGEVHGRHPGGLADVPPPDAQVLAALGSEGREVNATT